MPLILANTKFDYLPNAFRSKYLPITGAQAQGFLVSGEREVFTARLSASIPKGSKPQILEGMQPYNPDNTDKNPVYVTKEGTFYAGTPDGTFMVYPSKVKGTEIDPKLQYFVQRAFTAEDLDGYFKLIQQQDLIKSKLAEYDGKLIQDADLQGSEITMSNIYGMVQTSTKTKATVETPVSLKDLIGKDAKISQLPEEYSVDKQYTEAASIIYNNNYESLTVDELLEMHVPESLDVKKIKKGLRKDESKTAAFLQNSCGFEEVLANELAHRITLARNYELLVQLHVHSTLADKPFSAFIESFMNNFTMSSARVVSKKEGC